MFPNSGDVNFASNKLKKHVGRQFVTKACEIENRIIDHLFTRFEFTKLNYCDRHISSFHDSNSHNLDKIET